MAQATITITDIDLDLGTVQSHVEVTETQIDDGHVTAAHFFAMHIKDCLRDPKFLADVWAKAERTMAEHVGGTLLNADQRIAQPANDEATASVA